jgi:CrcB protein
MDNWAQLMVQAKVVLAAATQPLTTVGGLMHPALKKLFLVVFGGGLGAASRYGIGLLAARVWGTHFPWGTLTANLIGCFLIGLLFALADRARLLSPDIRLLLITGYLGALTTFSSFALETVNAGRIGLALQPLANILINNIGGLALTYIGMRIGGLK